MSKAKWARLTSNLPDDQIEEGHDIIRLGGLGVSEAVAETLREMGFIVEGPEEAGLNGWELYPRRGKLRIWIQISDFGDGFLLGTCEMGMFRSERRRRWFVDEFVAPFSEALRKNPAITEVAWVDPHGDFETGGAYVRPTPSRGRTAPIRPYWQARHSS